MIARALGLLAGVAADAVLGDPRRGHPVAAFGAWASWLEGRLYADSRPRGAAFTAAALAPVATLGLVAERATAGRPVAAATVTAAATWAVLGARSLRTEGLAMADRLASGDVDAARAQLPHLCGRDPRALDAPELARATVESLAENTADGAVASLAWGALAGVPGLLVHRGANTLDAMVGHRSPRYARFGTASARLDDALDWLPARITGALACAAAPLVGGSSGRAWHVMRRDARDHPSPNGGWCEAAWAGALGVRLGGANVYGDHVEVRGTLGDADAPRPDAAAVRKASRLVTWVTAAATLLAGAAVARPGRVAPDRRRARPSRLGHSGRPGGVGERCRRAVR
ncbi:cobalamin biosynthesis protein [Nigerium massiliense]|uniref:cobalamin biosynthesis protein n=1 Tax=Nigerium massiliense TaxID=1522317 RepID=UPI000907C982|nr:cobalamin biosynthesis protein [Nigerium massiliense]